MLLICPDFPKSVFITVNGLSDFSQDKSIVQSKWIAALKSYFTHINYFDHLESCLKSLDQLLDNIQNSNSW
jgi:hypothetical protein